MEVYYDICEECGHIGELDTEYNYFKILCKECKVKRDIMLSQVNEKFIKAKKHKEE